jgi:hypothetical protein
MTYSPGTQGGRRTSGKPHRPLVTVRCQCGRLKKMVRVEAAKTSKLWCAKCCKGEGI